MVRTWRISDCWRHSVDASNMFEFAKITWAKHFQNAFYTRTQTLNTLNTKSVCLTLIMLLYFWIQSGIKLYGNVRTLQWNF